MITVRDKGLALSFLFLCVVFGICTWVIAGVLPSEGGAAGKGFAVVGNEVKALAAQTADATEDICIKVDHINAVAARTVAQIEQISQIISEARMAQAVNWVKILDDGAVRGQSPVA